MLQAELRTLTPTLLMGHCLPMTLAQNRTAELWSGFMPQRHTIAPTLGPELYSVQVYDTLPQPGPGMLTQPFVKWATLAVPAEAPLPEGMQQLQLPGGLYAVFQYRGLPSQAGPFFQAIFTQWLPASGYALDHRPHFERLDHRYSNNDPASEEEVWIPIKAVGSEL